MFSIRSGAVFSTEEIGSENGWECVWECMNPELRQRSEGDRQQQEIQLLREEVRIKDARMEQPEAH